MKSGKLDILRSAGFTLIELIITIVIVGVIGSTIAIFAKGPVDAYYQTQKRAEMAQSVSIAVSKIKRELRLSLPNSVRTNGNTIEFIPAYAAARYRTGSGGLETSIAACFNEDPNTNDADAAGILSIGFRDNCFETMGIPDSVQKLCPSGTCSFNGNLHAVVFNMGAGYPFADAYENGFASTSPTVGNKASVASLKNESSGTAKSVFVTFSQNNNFKYDSPANRVFFVGTPIAYQCEPASDGTLSLYRYSGYTPASAGTQPSTLSIGSGTRGLVLKSLASCSINYSPGALTGKYGIVSFALEKTSSEGKLDVLMETVVSNVP